MKEKFKKIYIEITNVCNLSCEFCPKTKRPVRFMTVKEFERIIAQVSLRTDHIYFHIMGEPMLNKNIEHFLEISGRYGLKVNLTTNGTLLHQFGERLLQHSALRQINISLHSYEANLSDKTLMEYMHGVMEFVKKAHVSSNIICGLRLWNMDSEELKGANGRNQEIITMIEQVMELEGSLKEKLLASHGVKLCDRVFLNMAEKFEWPDIDRQQLTDEVFCYGLRHQIGVLVDGTVVPCCLDSEGSIALGNVYTTPLDEILDGERARKIYDGFSKRKAVEELCKKCAYATKFSKK